MKEYKLSRISKYSVLYLLCGLFMFFFMFAIFNLCSYAKTTSFNLKTANPRPTTSGGSCTVSFGTPSFTVNIPADSSLAQGQSKTFYYSTNLYVTTTSGTFLLRTDNFNFNATVYPSQINTFTSDLHMSGIGSFDLDGQFISADLVLDSDDPIDYYTFNGSEYGTMSSGTYPSYRGDLYGSMRSDIKGFGISAVNSNFVSVSSSSSSSGLSSGSFSDYSNYSFVNTFSIIEDYPSNGYPDYSVSVGSPISLDFPSYNGNNLGYASGWTYFMNTNQTDYIFMASFRYPNTSPSFSGLHFYVQDEAGNMIYDLTNPSLVFSGGSANAFLYNMIFKFSLDTDNPTLYRFAINGSSADNFDGISFGLLSRKLTINDYMQYVKDNYNDISPTVGDLNQNTAQSVSDIGTAQTFETSAFDNFNTQFSSSGLDSFSLSYASTPLLWVSSIITNFYNNMPAMFQYLIMFVAFVGILCTVLNVFGRVVQRFGGGDSATKLNSKDVFSKIEKNGSI